jgi:lipoprotein NlpI
MHSRLLLTLGLALSLHLPNRGLGQDPETTETLLKQDKTLTELLATQPESLTLLSRRGDTRQFLARFAEAVTDFERMIALDPLQDAPHWRLGIAYYFTGAFSKSARQFAKYHAHDGHDRENGIWKFMAQAREEGLAAARRDMLVYPPQDREPFVALYKMFAGDKTPREVLQSVEGKSFEGRTQVVFFAKYYTGVYLALTGKTDEGLKLVNEAVQLFTPATAGQGGPGYMWQVARLHAAVLKTGDGAAKAP